MHRIQQIHNQLNRSISRSFFSTDARKEIKKVGMVGLGLMGHGIAQQAAQGGYQVVAVDMNETTLKKGMERIEKSTEKLLSKQVKKGKLTEEKAKTQYTQILDRIEPSTDTASLQECDLVIEAIIENVQAKKDFYGKLGKLVNPRAIFASNTSSLAISDFSAASGRAERMVGLHFFNPVQLMKLVEVIRTDATDPTVFDLCKNWAESIGKVAVSCKDTPGFIVNRLLVPNLAQAIAMIERGDATKEDIDLSMQFGAGHPMGPLTLADYVGLDTTLFILQGWVEKYPNEPSFFIPDLLQEKVAQGKLGRKSGEGFYKWDGDKRL